jgi:flagellar hook-associated protein 1 FlgK
MSLTLAINSAITGLATAQAGLDVVSSNIANVNTEGYTRKVFNQESLVLAGKGAGVQLSNITRTVDDKLLQSVRNANSTVGSLQALNDYLSQVQDTFGTTATNSSLANAVNNLAQQFSTLAADAANSTPQLQTVQAAQQMAGSITTLGNTLQTLRLNADREIASLTDKINSDLQTISTLNDQIALNQATNRGTADLEDKRDTALNDLSTMIDIRYFKNANGSMTVFTTDGTTLVDSEPTTVSHVPLTLVNPTDSYAGGNFNGIIAGVRDITTSIRSGRLKGLIDLRDSTLPDMQAQIDELASALKTQINQIANRAVAFPASVNNLTGTTQFMSTSTTTMTISQGEPNIILFDPSGNEAFSSRLLDTAGINFTNGGTLDDMASAVQTWVRAQDPQLANATVAFNSTGQLTVNLGTDAYSIGFRDEQSAIKGSGQQDATIGLDLDGDGQIDKTQYGFSNFLGLNDFFVSTPNLTEWTSGFKPANYTLTTTSARTLSFADTDNPTGIPGGTITVNPNDSLENIAAAINANTALHGIVEADVIPEAGGQRLRIRNIVGNQLVVTQQGGTDAVDALDLNPTTGGVSQSLAVNQSLINNASLVPKGQAQLDPLTGKYVLGNAENSVAMQLADLMTNQAPIKAAGSLAAGNITFADYAGTIISQSASQTSVAQTNLQLQSDLQSAIELKQSQLSGVNLDEEMSQLLVYQRSYAAAAKVVSTTQSLFDVLNNMVR